MPGLIFFGPLFIVIGCIGHDYLSAGAGLFMTGTGNVILFMKPIDQSRQIEELLKHIQDGK